MFKNFNIRKLKSLLTQKRVKQVSVLYSSMIIGIVFGIIVSMINTRFLGPEEFGDYKFIHSAYTFFSLLLSVGVFVSIGRLIADKKNELIRKELTGAAIILTMIIGVFYCFAMVGFSFFQSQFFSKDLQDVFLIITPFFFFVPFTLSFENLFQGDNRIYMLAIFRQSPQLFYIIFALLFYKLGWFNLVTSIIIQLSTLGLLAITLTVRLKPEFKNFRTHVRTIFSENKRFGFHVYIGSLAGVASTHFGPIILSYFSVNNVDVGFYSLALMSTMPLVLIPSIAGTTMFKEFANRKEIPKKATLVTIGLSLFVLVVFLLLIKPLVILLYTDKFVGVVPLAFIVSIAQIFHGFGDYHNKFMGAHGQGKKLRNAAFTVGISNLIGFVFVIPFFGAYGAAFTKLTSGIVYMITMVFYYRKYVKSIA